MITRRRFLGSGLASLLAVQYSELFEHAVNGQVVDRSPGALAVPEAIAGRRTVRSFSSRILRQDHLMGVFWAAQGVTDSIKGFRAVPSAGALYPLEVYAFLGEETVAGLNQGVYRYRPSYMDTEKINKEDLRKELAAACMDQMWVGQAPLVLVVSAVFARTTFKYKQRGRRYAMIEAGCAAQNVFLMAGSLGLNAGIVGAFDDKRVQNLAGADLNAEPLLVMPVGYSA